MNEDSNPAPACPNCRKGGRAVKAITLQSLLRPEARERNSSAASWQFCATPDCDTVYYDAEGTTTFAKNDLTVRVGIKETTGPRPVCYCFDHTIEEIEEQIHATGRTNVLDDIKTRMQEACWCETKSPMGSCCLATVTKHIKAAEKFGGSALESGAALPVEDCCASRTIPESVAASGKASVTEKISWVGGILSAVIASACCWLPLLLVAVGVSGAAVSAAFEAYRPYFMALTFAFLAAAFYFAYRPRRSCANHNVDSCRPPSKAGGGALQTANRSVLWLVTVLAAAFLFFPSYVGLLSGNGDSLSGRDDLDKAALKIEGMTCASCAAGLEKKLRKLPGVAAAEVSYDEQSAVIGFAKGTEIDREPILAAVKAAGFTGQFNDRTR